MLASKISSYKIIYLDPSHNRILFRSLLSFANAVLLDTTTCPVKVYLLSSSPKVLMHKTNVFSWQMQLMSSDFFLPMSVTVYNFNLLIPSVKIMCFRGVWRNTLRAENCHCGSAMSSPHCYQSTNASYVWKNMSNFHETF